MGIESMQRNGAVEMSRLNTFVTLYAVMRVNRRYGKFQTLPKALSFSPFSNAWQRVMVGSQSVAHF